MKMKISGILVYILVLVFMVAGPGSGEVTTQMGVVGAGNVYTTGSIFVESSPPGASALLDGGVDQLVTPGTFGSVIPGLHTVQVTKPGYQPSSQNIDVRIGARSNLIMTLVQITDSGGIFVRSDPRGADLYIDGLFLGTTDQTVGGLAPGPHSVKMKTAGYLEWTETVVVESGRIAKVTAKLIQERSASTGDIRVTSSPPGSSVYVDGNYMGVIPPDETLDITDLNPGSYLIVFRKSGYIDYSTTTAIEAGKVVQIDATLRPGGSTPAGANAEIVSNPGGADVYINGQFLGITPLFFQNVTPGTYTVELKMDGYVPYSSSGQAAAGQDIEVIANLAPLAPVTLAPTTEVAPISIAGVLAGVTGYLFVSGKYRAGRSRGDKK
ncbi:MAG: PEGA domain-containing protein [Methanoregulaceae archaeon]|nr:PEGA domain-containing protein [Methanoregulaceae archaeon]